MNDLNDIRKNYRNFDDSKIIRLARLESGGLRKEVIPILEGEIRRRKLGEQLIEWVRANALTFTESELKELVERIKAFSCPECGNNDEKLKCFHFHQLISYLIGSSQTEFKLCVCANCGRKRKQVATFWTVLFGWWSISGIFATSIYLISELRRLIFPKNRDMVLIDFIKENKGGIVLEEKSDASLKLSLKKFNQVNTHHSSILIEAIFN